MADDEFVLKRSSYRPNTTLVDLVNDRDNGDDDSHILKALGRNPFERGQPRKESEDHVVKRLKLSRLPTSGATTAATTAAPTGLDLPAPEQRFTVDIVKYILSLSAPEMEAHQPKFSNDALKATGELLHLFACEATKRSKDELEKQDDQDEARILMPEHLLRILPKLLLDF